MEPGCADPCLKLVVRVAVLVSVRPRVATLLLCGPRVGCRAKVFMRLRVSLRFSDLMAASTHTWQVVQKLSASAEPQRSQTPAVSSLRLHRAPSTSPGHSALQPLT